MTRCVPRQICIAAFCMVASTSISSSGTLPSFPGAEGFGAVSVGGRGGRVIKVTNLNASGPGSLQAACAERGPRIIVFDVGGVIRGDIAIAHSNVTIAGQSAPSPGITIVGRLLARSADDKRLHDIIVRHLRIRPPPAAGEDGDAIQLPMTERVMLDHLSLAWANDEMIDIIHSSEVTVQWSTIEESDPTGHAKGVPHNYAILSAYPGSGNVSIHHNLFAHHSRRLPSLSPQVEGKPGDFRNNVVYNFRDGFSHEGHQPKAPINLIGNYYKRGPNSNTIHPFNFYPAGSYFVAENYFEEVGVVHDPRASRKPFPSWIQFIPDGRILKNPANVAVVTTESAIKSFQNVLSFAGAWPRDRVTLRTLREVRQGTGGWGRDAPAVPSNDWFLEGLVHARPAKDSDGDGLPDKWERVHGLDPANKVDQSRLVSSGYTAIEEFLNERAFRSGVRGSARGD